MGTAKQHAKWQTAVAPRFYQAPKLTVSSGKGSKTVIDTVGKESLSKIVISAVRPEPISTKLGVEVSYISMNKFSFPS